MSIEALLVAARNHLRTQLIDLIPGATTSAAAAHIDIRPEGRPPARWAGFYIGLDEGRVQSTEKAFLREVYTIEVYVYRQTGEYSDDRHGDIYTKNVNGLGVLERRVIRAIHNSHTIMAAANAILADDARPGDIIQQPLWYTGRGKTRYGATGADERSMKSFMQRVLPFSGGVRNQDIDIMA